MTFIEIIAIIIAILIVILVVASNIYKIKKKGICSSCSCCDGSCNEKIKKTINKIKLELDNK